MRMDRGGAIAGVRCRSESAAEITKPISGFVKRLPAAGNETFFASCATQGAKKGVFRSPALCRKQKGGLFRALRCAGSKKRVFFGPCVVQEAKKGLFRSPALCRKQKGGLFRALRCAGSKKGVFFGPCVVQEAKKGVFRGPALCRKQKRVSFGALRCAGNKKGQKRGDHRSGRPFAYPPVGERNDE